MVKMEAKKKPTIVPEEEEETSSDESDNFGVLKGCVSDCNGSVSERSLPGSVARSERAMSRSRTPIDLTMLQEEEEESGESNHISSQGTDLTENVEELTVDKEPGLGLGSNGDMMEQPGPARALLEELRRRHPPEIVDTPRNALDNAQDLLGDHATLCAACYRLQVASKDKKLDVLFRARVVSMVGTLNLFLDLELTYTWKSASLVTSKAQGHGVKHTQHIREWALNYIQRRELPLHRLGRTKTQSGPCLRMKISPGK
jgi:hypothetical protein